MSLAAVELAATPGHLWYRDVCHWGGETTRDNFDLESQYWSLLQAFVSVVATSKLGGLGRVPLPLRAADDGGLASTRWPSRRAPADTCRGSSRRGGPVATADFMISAR